MTYQKIIRFHTILLLFVFIYATSLLASAQDNRVIDLSSETKRFCALLQSGDSFCWGKGFRSFKPPKEENAKKIMAGTRCYLKEDNTLSCWSVKKRLFSETKKAKAVGEIDGELCLITEEDSIQCYPKNKNPKPGLKAKAISVGVNFYCAIQPDDTLHCWGNLKYDRVTMLGNAIKRKVKSISSYHNSCAIDLENNLLCWKVGFDSVHYPKIKVKQVDVGPYHYCAIKMNDRVICWGDNSYGQTDVAKGLKAKKVVTNERGSCAITMENQVFCWGQKNRPQTDVPKGLKAKKLHSSFADMCVIDQNDRLRCWGRTYSDGVKGTDKVKDIVMEYDRYCVIKMDDTLDCRGSYYDRKSPAMDSIRSYLKKLKVKKAFFVDSFQDCVLTLENEVVCWQAPGKIKQPEYPSGYRFKTVSFSDIYSCGITFQDQPICWIPYQLTDNESLFDIPEDIAVPKPDREKDKKSSDNSGTSAFAKISGFFKQKFSKEQKKSPPKIIKWSTVSPKNIHASSMKVKKILAFRYGACAIKMDENMICWGVNKFGETNYPRDTKFKELFAISASRICGKDFKNIVTCWGDEDREKNHSFPRAKVVSIWARNDGGCIIDMDDKIYCWGRHDTGLWNSPKGMKAKQLATTPWSACAVKMDDTVVCWGHLSWMKPIMKVVPKEIRATTPAE